MRPHSRSGIIVVLLAPLLLFVNLPVPAQTTDSKGIGVLQVQGSVSLGGTSAATGATIYAGDSIRTGLNGTALVNLTGRGSIVMAPNSDLTFPPVSLGSHSVALHHGKFALHILPEGSGTTAELGKLVLRPLIGQGVDYEVEIEADGSAVVHCISGTVGIIEVEGANSTFLNSGDSAEISASGVTERIPASATPLPNSSAPNTPQSTPRSPSGKSNAGWIILAASGGGIAALVAVIAIEHKTTPVSPSAP